MEENSQANLQNSLEKIDEQMNLLDSRLKKLNEEKDVIVSSIEHRTINGIKKWLSLWIGGGVLSIILMGGSIYSEVTKNAEEFLTKSISYKFSDSKINKTLTEVAQNEAKEMIEERLDPAIDNAKLSIVRKTIFLDKTLKEFKNNYDLQINMLLKEVEYLKIRNEILRLGDKAIASGESSALEELLRIRNLHINDDVGTAAISEISRIKNFFGTMSRDSEAELIYTDPTTNVKFKNEEIPTEALILELKNQNNLWQYRSRAVRIMANRREKGVPESLLEILKNDQKLDVRKCAMDSFVAVTGFKRVDIFGDEYVSVWWNANKKNVEERFKELGTIEKALKEKFPVL